MKILSLLLLLTCSLVADDDLKNKLEVGEISFEGNKMLLSGDFKWEHSFGNISAKSATACFDCTDNPWTPHEISMQEGVAITMKDGGELKSPYAWLGCRQWLGVFHGREGQKISYEKKSDLLSLKSLRMELNFLPPRPGYLVLLERLVADGQVEIGLGSDVRLTSDQAIFDEFSSKGAFGRASIRSHDNSFCNMTQELQDGLANKVECERAEFDLRGNKGVLYNPEGVLQRDGVPLFFKASEMTVDKESDEIVLQPPVTIDWFGRLDSSGKVEIARKNKKLYSVQVQGSSKLFWKDSQGNEHRLNIPGVLEIYPEEHFIKISNVGNGQIFFSDQYGQIYSDQILLTFQEVSSKLEPLKITFEGGVRLQNNNPGNVQYALADEAFFEFGEKTLILQSKSRPRVLFYDELNKIEASAPSLVINRDPKTGQNVMRGMGNVRFMFAEEELNELKKRFSLETRK